MPGLYFRDPADGQYKPLSTGGGVGSDVEVIISATKPTDENNELWVDTTQESFSPSTIPAGAIMAWAGATAPSGWQLCNGTLLSRASYPNLFAAIGVTYGIGDGVTTFATPDLQGRMIVASGTGFSLNASGGAATHTLTTAQMPSHTHTVTDPGGWNVSAMNQSPVAGGTGFYIRGSTVDLQANATGGGQAHNNMPPYFVLNYIIKL